MQFIKAQWISLLCGVVALAAIALAVVGMTNQSVHAEMRKRADAAKDISMLRTSPQNEETIAAQKELGQRFETEYASVVQTAESINQRPPLLESAFPKPARLDVQYHFKEVYAQALEELPRQLSGGDLPNDQEVLDEAEVMAEKARQKEAEEGKDEPELAGGGQPTGDGGVGRGGRGAPSVGGGRGAPAPGGGRGAAPAGGRGTPPAAEPSGRGAPGGGRGAPAESSGRSAPQTAGGRGGGRGAAAAEAGGRGSGAAAGAGRGANMQGLPTGVSGEEAHHRAAVRKARSIRTYVSPYTTFHVSPVRDAEGAPSPRDMWYAQVGLWIQEDVIRAIARLNDEAAQKKAGQEVNVASMPVKRIESIRVAGYVTGTGAVVPFPSVGGGGGGLGAPSVTSFTGRKSDAQFDIVHFTLTAVVDQRDLFRLVDVITRQNFYQLVGLEYTHADAEDPAGYLYGEAPVVRAVLDFEGYMARKLYKEMMPADVLKDLGIGGEGAKPGQPAAPAAPAGRGSRGRGG